VRGSRSVIASVGVGLWGLAVISIAAAKVPAGQLRRGPTAAAPRGGRAGGALPAVCATGELAATGARLRAVPHGGAGAGLVGAPGAGRLGAGPEPAGHRVCRCVGARGARAGLAVGQGSAAGPRGQQAAAGPGRDDRALRDGRPWAGRAQGGPGPRYPRAGGGARR
jgi:hypothetical protein